MRILHFYLIRQVLSTLVMTVVVFTFILLLGSVLKEVLTLLVNGQANPLQVFKAIVFLIPYVLVFALPMGLLTATLLVFGRFSADQELTAARASGISLLSLVSPILMLALLFSFLCAYINLDLGPRSREAYKQLLFQIGMAKPSGWILPNQYVQLDHYAIYTGEKNGDELKDIVIFDISEKEQRWFKAPEGRLDVDTTNSQISLTLIDAVGVFRRGANVTGSEGETMVISIEIPKYSPPEEPDLSDMSYSQLRQKLASLKALGGNTETLMPVLVQMHRQISFSFASFGFALIGIPLGIRTHRKETTIGMAISLVLVLVYYSFIMLAETFETRADLKPYLILWLPNFFFQILGAFLLWRADRRVS